ncbi:MAG: VWA domain-containing protein [Mariprofundaceae bacterium]|nr:VWA domain-containing protein [Mariprofundaceae bacterium]
MIWEQFHFLRPWCFLLLLPLFYLLYHYLLKRSSLQTWQKLCEPALLHYLQAGSEKKTSWFPLAVVGLVGILLTTALAGPAWQQLPQPVYRAQSALVIVLDLSRSMDAGDIQPSRLTRAKQKTADLLSLRNIGQSALLVFAGSAFTVTPLSDDNATILLQLQGLDTSIMPAQGGNIDAALRQAVLLLQQSSIQHGQVLLLTDSDTYSNQAAQDLVQQGHQLHVIGIGTALGAPIRQQTGGFVTDTQGNIIMPSLNTARLQQLAATGHGFYHALSLDNTDIQPLLNTQLADHVLDAAKSSSQSRDMWREEGTWLILLVLPLLLMGFRRGLLVLICCIYLQPMPAKASVWSDMWQTQDAQAQKMLQDQDYAQAAQTFKSPSWQAVAAYKQQDYAAANQAFQRLEQPSITDMYNQGNTLAHLGNLAEAIKMYAQVLALDAAHDDARQNKLLVQDMLKQQQENDAQNNAEQGEQEQSGDGEQSEDQGKSSPSQEEASDDNQAGSEQAGDSKSDEEPTDGEGESNGEQTDEEEDKTAPSQPQDNQAQDKPEKDITNNEDDDSQQAPQPPTTAQTPRSEEDQTQAEQQQAFEYQLRRIPDDPARLLRNKFKYQYQQQQKRR